MCYKLLIQFAPLNGLTIILAPRHPPTVINQRVNIVDLVNNISEFNRMVDNIHITFKIHILCTLNEQYCGKLIRYRYRALLKEDKLVN